MKKAIIEITVDDDYGTYGEDDCEGCPFTNNETDECGLDNFDVTWGCPVLIEEDKDAE